MAERGELANMGGDSLPYIKDSNPSLSRIEKPGDSRV